MARRYEDITNQRSDWFWKLAHTLTDRFDVLCVETLNLKGKIVTHISQWYPSSKTCHHCAHGLKELDLSTRIWRCPSCRSVNDRDENAAKNICMIGASTIKLGDVRRALPAIVV